MAFRAWLESKKLNILVLTKQDAYSDKIFPNCRLLPNRQRSQDIHLSRQKPYVIWTGLRSTREAICCVVNVYNSQRWRILSATRVTRCIREKMAQNEAQPVFLSKWKQKFYHENK
jgi:hypothetical protein